MNKENEIEHVFVTYEEKDVKKVIALDFVPDSTTYFQLLQNVLPIFFPDEKDLQKISSNLAFVANGEVKLSSEFVTEKHLQLVKSPKEYSPLSDFFILTMFIIMLCVPIEIFLSKGSVSNIISSFVICMNLYVLTLYLFKKKDYNSIMPKFDPNKKRPVLIEAIVLFFQSMLPNFHLEDILIHN